MTLTIKLDRNWNSFQLANSAPPLSVTDSAIAPSARICIVPIASVISDRLYQTRLLSKGREQDLLVLAKRKDSGASFKDLAGSCLVSRE